MLIVHSVMETLTSDTVHTSESIRSSLSCIDTHHIDEELSKEKEDELLYGAGEDGDEEETLSDDSMRLRLSDDEDEPEDTVIPASNQQKNETQQDIAESASMKTTDVQASSASENNILKNDTIGNEVKQEEQCSGNVSMDDKVLTNHRKDIKMNNNGITGSRVANVPHYPRPNYDFPWRFTCFPPVRQFNFATRFSYPRSRSCIRSPRYRNNYYRFHYNVRPFTRGRGSETHNFYYKGSHDDRNNQKHFQSSFISKPDIPNEINLPSSSVNTSIGNDLDNSINNTTNVDSNNQIKDDSTLDSNLLINTDKDRCSLNESTNENIETIKSKDQNIEKCSTNNNINNSLGKHEVKFAGENENLKTVSNNIENENPVSIHTPLEDLTNGKSMNFLEHSHDNNEEISKEDEINVNDTASNVQDLCYLKDPDTTETSTVENVKHKDKNGILEHTEKVNINKEIGDEINVIIGNVKTKENETDKILQPSETEKHEENEHAIDKEHCDNLSNLESQSIKDSKLSETHCKTSNDAGEREEGTENTTPHSKIIDSKGEENLEASVDNSVEITKSNKDVQISTFSVSNSSGNSEKHLKNGIKAELPSKSSIPESITEPMECEKYQVNESNDSTNVIKIAEPLSPENQLDLPKNDLQIQSEITNASDKDLVDNEDLPVTNSIEKSEDRVEKTECKLEENDSSDVPLANTTGGNDVKENLTSRNKDCLPVRDSLLDFATDNKNNSDNNENKNGEVPVVSQKKKRRTKKMIAAAREAAIEEDNQVKDVGRKKRKTAKNAEEIIRTNYSNHDSDLESSDSSEKFVIVNHKTNQNARSLSPPSLKRNCPDTDAGAMNGNVKKVKSNPDTLPNESTTKENDLQNVKKLNYIHKFFQRDLKEKLPKLRQEELEELLIQKIVETITMRGEIGKLREQARISEKNQEATRARCQQLAKQIKDFEMVLNRNAADRRANNDKPTAPIKINRSVGLQVNFVTEQGMQNLRQLQQASSIKTLNTSNTETNNITNASSPRKGIKVRSPRRIEPSPVVQTAVVPQNHPQTPPIMPTVTPAALVVAKPLESQHTSALPNQTNAVQQLLPTQQVQPQQQQQAIVLNGKLPNQINRQSTAINIASQSRTNDLIDLTDEEEKSKGAINIPVVTTTITDQQINMAQKSQPCFQRVIQTIPGNVAITSPATSIRVVQPASQPTPTALVNNMNAPRLAYVMQSNMGPTRQLLIASNSPSIRPVTSCNRPSFSTLTYKTGISTVANGTVRFLTTPAGSNIQVNKHPAPLPDTRNYAVNPSWKLPPPAPSLKISKVANGIVLSWNMILSEKYAEIASYQLYAYQELSGVAPSTSLWKKVGDVRALPLPMACTLTQFSEGNNYYFAVRAVDTHSRKGQYSIPGNISL